MEGGYTIDDMIPLVRRLEGMGMDFVDVSTGIYESLELLIQPMDVPQGCLLPLARRMRQSVSIPVFGTGRIVNIDLAEKAVSEGDCDFVHMGRAFHADPAILEKSLAGETADIVRCVGCNKCCLELFVNRPSVCTVNVDAGRERFSALAPAANARRVMVVGGGMAGMEAARVAAERGHDVTLFEKTDRLGGRINVLRAPRHRANWGHAAGRPRAHVRERGRQKS